MTDQFDIMLAAKIADKAIKAANDGEAARVVCYGIKRDLDRRLKLALYINRVAVQKLAIRAGLADNTTFRQQKQMPCSPKRK